MKVAFCFKIKYFILLRKAIKSKMLVEQSIYIVTMNLCRESCFLFLFSFVSIKALHRLHSFRVPRNPFVQYKFLYAKMVHDFHNFVVILVIAFYLYCCRWKSHNVLNNVNRNSNFNRASIERVGEKNALNNHNPF